VNAEAFPPRPHLCPLIVPLLEIVFVARRIVFPSSILTFFCLVSRPILRVGQAPVALPPLVTDRRYFPRFIFPAFFILRGRRVCPLDHWEGGEVPPQSRPGLFIFFVLPNIVLFFLVVILSGTDVFRARTFCRFDLAEYLRRLPWFCFRSESSHPPFFVV